jgi:hypothetical protein
MDGVSATTAKAENNDVASVPKRCIAEMIARMREIGAPEDGVQVREPFEAPDRPGL